MGQPYKITPETILPQLMQMYLETLQTGHCKLTALVGPNKELVRAIKGHHTVDMFVPEGDKRAKVKWKSLAVPPAMSDAVAISNVYREAADKAMRKLAASRASQPTPPPPVVGDPADCDDRIESLLVMIRKSQVAIEAKVDQLLNELMGGGQ